MSCYMSLEHGLIRVNPFIGKSIMMAPRQVHELYCVSQTEEKQKIHLFLILPYSAGVLHSVMASGFSVLNHSEGFCL